MRQLVIRHVDVPWPAPPGRPADLRIAHVSDLHLRRWSRVYAELQEALCRETFDLLAITGDLGDRPSQFAQVAALARRLLGPVQAPLGMFAVLGNHDHWHLAQEDLPFTVLRNRVCWLSAGTLPVGLVGVDQHCGRRGTFAEAAARMPAGTRAIVLAHYPSTAYELPPGQGILMLAGHTHGGQIRLPMIGCAFTQDDIPRSMARGLHHVQGNWLHVSPGIGTTALPLRILCPPELSLITLRSVPLRFGDEDGDDLVASRGLAMQGLAAPPRQVDGRSLPVRRWPLSERWGIWDEQEE